MTVTHMIFGKMRKELEKDQARADRAYRIWNEVPTILMIIIVIMAVVEPI
jgi:putative membrane protein